MILSILGISYLKKQGLVYLIISIICFVFGQIYELFSHGVYSNFMIFSFTIPLVLGCGLSWLLIILKKDVNRIFINLYNSSVASFTVYSIVRGVLEIYGTTNSLIKIYIVVGIVLMIIGIKKQIIS